VRVVYLHGFASGPTSRKAKFFKARLEEENVEVTVPDLSQGDFEHLTITGQILVLEEAVGEGPVRLVGSSMGGYLAALFAARNPQRVEKLVLMAPAFGFAGRWHAVAGKEGLQRWLTTGKLPIFHYGEGRIRELDLAMYKDSKKWEGEPDFTQSALIFHGVKDTVVPIDASREFAAGHGNVELIEMDSDHELTDVLQQIWAGCREFLLD
jgi:pimeloyl-ACP methyl ester carboxylesterase